MQSLKTACARIQLDRGYHRCGRECLCSGWKGHRNLYLSGKCQGFMAKGGKRVENRQLQSHSGSTCNRKEKTLTMTNNREDGCTCRLSGFVVRNRLAIIAGVLIITAAAAFGITRIQTDVIISDLFPQNHPYLQLMKRFGEVFGEGVAEW